MIHSMAFGRAFWLDDNDEFCSAPWRTDGSVDMYRLMDIVKRLIDDKMNMYSKNITTYAANITREQIKSGIKGNLL